MLYMSTAELFQKKKKKKWRRKKEKKVLHTVQFLHQSLKYWMTHLLYFYQLSMCDNLPMWFLLTCLSEQYSQWLLAAAAAVGAIFSSLLFLILSMIALILLASAMSYNKLHYPLSSSSVRLFLLSLLFIGQHSINRLCFHSLFKLSCLHLFL